MSIIKRFDPFILSDDPEWWDFCSTWYGNVLNNIGSQRFGQAVYNAVPQRRLASHITLREAEGETLIRCDPFDNDDLVEVFTQEIYKLWKEQR